MGGIDNLRGIDYQNCIGVMRIIDLIDNDELLELEFESDGELLTDITHFFPERKIIMEQIKKKDDGSWTPSKLHAVMEHFIAKWDRFHEQFKLEFLFTTYESPNSDLKRVEREIKRYRKRRDNDKPDVLIEKIRPICPEGADIEKIKKIAVRTNFNWNEGAPNDFDNPTAQIIQKCKDLLSSKCGMTEDDRGIKFNELYRQVIEFSSTKSDFRRYTRKDLQKIVPDCVNVEKRLLQLNLPENVLRWLLKNDITYVAIDVSVSDNKEIFTPDAFIKIGRKECAIWILRTSSTQTDLSRINRIIEKKKHMTHMVICLDDNIDIYDFVDEVRPIIVWSHTINQSGDITKGENHG